MTDNQKLEIKEPLIEKNEQKLKGKKNPLLLQEIELNTDLYALTWSALRCDVWENLKPFRGEKISLTSGDFCKLMTNFFAFFFLVLVTILVLLYEVFTNNLYMEASWSIVILRIALLGFSQQALQPEFYQALVKLRFSIKNPEKFNHLCFAWIVCWCQLLIATITFFCVLIFVSMADSPLELIMDFGGMMIFAELDDWIGEAIVNDKPNGATDRLPNELFDLDGLNRKMKVTDKLSLIKDELTLVDDQNYVTSKSCFIISLSHLLDYFPWVLLPLLTIPMTNILVYIQPHHAGH